MLQPLMLLPLICWIASTAHKADKGVTGRRCDVEIFAQVNGEAFSITRMIDGRTGNAGALIERQSGYKVTTRNWKTIMRLLDKYG